MCYMIRSFDRTTNGFHCKRSFIAEIGGFFGMLLREPARRETTSEMPGISPIDPRDMGPNDVKIGLLGELRRRRVVDVVAREPMLRLTTELSDVPFQLAKGLLF